MKSLKNSVRLVGRLGNAPELKTFNEKSKVARFNLATNEYFTSQNGDRSKITQWHSMVAWGSMAEFVSKNLSKGEEVMLEGKLTYREYTDKNHIKRFVTEIVIENLQKLSFEQAAA